jgi:hypothetical protein
MRSTSATGRLRVALPVEIATGRLSYVIVNSWLLVEFVVCNITGLD